MTLEEKRKENPLAEQIEEPRKLEMLEGALMARSGNRKKITGTQERMLPVGAMCSPCPWMDEYEEYADWRKAYTFWSAATEMSGRRRAMETLASVGNDMKHYPKELKSMVMGSLSQEQVENPNAEDILKLLDRWLRTKGRRDVAWEAYVKFEECVIRPGERYRDFVARFEATWNVARREDKHLEISEEMLAKKLEFAARLSPFTRMAVEASVRRGSVEMWERTMEVIGELHEGQRYEDKHEVKLMTANGKEEKISLDGETAG